MTALKKLLILGGNSLNILSVLEAKNHGFYTIVADKNPEAASFALADEALCVDIIDPEAIYNALKDKGIQGIVSMAEAGVVSGAMVSERLGLGGVSVQSAINATSKAAMRRLWAEIPEYSVKFKMVKTLEEAKAAVSELGVFPLICKPDKTFGGSRGVSKIENADHVKAAFEFASISGMTDVVVIEEFATGIEYSCEVLVYGGEVSVLCTGRKVKSPPPYRVDLSVQYGSPLTETESAAIADMCTKATRALGVTDGVAHVEFALTGDGPRLFELGLRCGGGHTPIIAKHVSGVNEFVEYCRIASGEKPDGFSAKEKKGADYRFIIFPPGKLAGIEVSKEVYNHPGIKDLVLSVKADDTVNELRTTSDRSGAIVTFGNTIEEAVSMADWACKNITVTYADGTSAHALSI